MTEFKKGDVCSLEVTVVGENPARRGSIEVQLTGDRTRFFPASDLTLLRRAPVDLATCEIGDGVDVVTEEGWRATLLFRDGDVGFIRYVEGARDARALKCLRLRPADAPAHDLYKIGDPDIPSSILDRNGDVALGLCKRCGRGEIELCEPCNPICPPGHFMIGDRAVPEPMREAPEVGARYWIASATSTELAISSRWGGGWSDLMWLDRGLIHSTEAAAIAHFEAIVALSKREG